jgi:hypothetical protein
MPDELDHEVIDSPQALFRHLYEAHGVIEALDLDTETAPLQFWLRRHAELERAAVRATVEERRSGGPAPRAAPRDSQAPRQGPAPRPEPPPDRSSRPGRPPWRARPPAEQASPAATSTTRVAADTAAPASPRGAASPGGSPAPGSGSGPRFRPFTDPVVEALAVALVARGLDERRVRRGLSTFTGADRRHGEDAVRATFVVPMLDAVAAYLAGHPQHHTQWPPPTWPPVHDGTAAPQPARTPPPRDPAPAPREPVPDAAPAPVAAGAARAGDESLIAQPLAAPAAGPAPDADFMAIADVLQERRRTRRNGRRGGGAESTAQAAGTVPPRAPDDDVMALADALQHRRARGRN